MYHYFTGLDFRWCGSTPCESSRIVKCLRRIYSSWVYWTWMHHGSIMIIVVTWMPIKCRISSHRSSRYFSAERSESPKYFYFHRLSDTHLFVKRSWANLLNIKKLVTLGKINHTCKNGNSYKHRHARRARVIFLCEVSEIGAFMVQ